MQVEFLGFVAECGVVVPLHHVAEVLGLLQQCLVDVLAGVSALLLILVFDQIRARRFASFQRPRRHLIDDDPHHREGGREEHQQVNGHRPADRAHGTGVG